MQTDPGDAILSHLIFLYGPEVGQAAFAQLQQKLNRTVPPPYPFPPLDHTDSLLITYGDQFVENGKPPLETLASFCRSHLAGLISGVHILPFFPYSSDDGFSVIDYHQIDPRLGEWEDITLLGQDFRLMVDAVINHISQHSIWFQQFLRDDPRYRDAFIAIPPETDLSQVVRPRALPLLTPFETHEGEKLIWTTFSADQVDLNYKNPRVLLDIIDVLLNYIARGAQLIRLDAIAYLWKEPGTTSIHLPQTHRIVQLFRSVVDAVAPGVLLITETNVPHQENLSYFGDGSNEAHLVYNFALPPLVLQAFLSGQANVLSNWAASLELPSPQVTFFNFLASHDGIGLNPARGILSEEEILQLVEAIRQRGGLVSSKTNPDGSLSPYELNISYFDALSSPDSHEPLALQVDRFLAAQAILLAMPGLPGIYVHSLLGSRNWLNGVRQTGHNRTINRQKFQLDALLEALEQAGSSRQLTYEGYSRLLKARRSSTAFHPYGSHRVISAGDSIFALVRISPERNEGVICLHNVSSSPQTARIDVTTLDLHQSARNLLNQQVYDLKTRPDLQMDPYQVLWLQYSPGEP
jgi:glucosylglycerate phosphorylase